MELFEKPYFIQRFEGIGGFCAFEKLQPLTPYQGILLEPEINPRKITTHIFKIAEYTKEHWPNEFYNSPDMADIRPFIWNGYRPEIKYTRYHYPNEWIDGYSKQKRYEVKKFAELKPEVSDSLNDFDWLYEETFRRKDMKRPVSKAFIEKMCGKIPHKVVVTYVGQFPKSGCVFIWDSKRAYYILGASLGNNAGAYAVDVGIQAMGDKPVDLVGVNIAEIETFKKGIGTYLVPYYGVRKCTKRR